MASAAGDSLSSKYQNVMSQMDDVIEHVLNCLPMKTLHTCARVCHKWNDVVQVVKRSRIELSWLLYNGKAQPTAHEQKKHVKTHLYHLSIQPEVALIFCGPGYPEDPDDYDLSDVDDANETVDKLVRMVQKVLPPTCGVYGMQLPDGVFGFTRTRKLLTRTGLSCLLLPHLPGIDVYPFALGEEITDLKKIGSLNEETFKPKKFDKLTGIPKDKKPKLVLLFNETYCPGDIAAGLVRRYRNLVVAGADVEALLTSKDSHGFDAIVQGLAFCGDNLKVASILLERNVRKLAQIEEALDKLKSAHVPNHNTVGFLFTDDKRKPKRDIKAFRTAFPDTPIFGMIGDGEIGYDYLPDYSKPEGDSNMDLMGEYDNKSDSDESDDEESRYDYIRYFPPEIPSDLPKCKHSRSAVFVLLSFGPFAK